MASPDHFEVAYVINPHMEGHIGSVDTTEARAQWTALQSAYKEIGIEAHEVAGAEGFPDMVFCANQTLPYFNANDDNKGVILSNMHADQRKGEVPHIGTFFKGQGYNLNPIKLENATDFEGMGDAIWHPEHYLLWGGYGYRTDSSVYNYISDQLNVKVIALELTDPDFYHLDTCFSVLSPEAVMIVPAAFTADGLAMIRHYFKQVIECPEDEARELLACNAHCPDQKHVIIQRGCDKTVSILKEAGFVPVEVDTSEFLKSGGSVFCMKQMFW